MASERADASYLADLDVLLAPGLLVTIHSGDRPALVDLRDPARWRRRLAPPPLSRAALELLLYAILDGYDDLIDDAEVEVERLQDNASTIGHRTAAARLLHHRRRMMAVRRQLSAQRELFDHLARSGSAVPPDGSWWINDRLEAAIGGATEAADYALAGVWSSRQASRWQGWQLGLILLAAWSTWLGVLVITRLADSGGPSAIDPLWFAGALLAVISVLTLATAVSHRWL